MGLDGCPDDCSRRSEVGTQIEIPVEKCERSTMMTGVRGAYEDLQLLAIAFRRDPDMPDWDDKQINALLDEARREVVRRQSQIDAVQRAWELMQAGTPAVRIFEVTESYWIVRISGLRPSGDDYVGAEYNVGVEYLLANGSQVSTAVVLKEAWADGLGELMGSFGTPQADWAVKVVVTDDDGQEVVAQILTWNDPVECEPSWNVRRSTPTPVVEKDDLSIELID